MIYAEEDRAIRIAVYMLEHNATVRQAARAFGISKSTVHKDVSQRLKNENNELFLSVKELLKINKDERHIRGGMATRQKYINLNESHTHNNCIDKM